MSCVLLHFSVLFFSKVKLYCLAYLFIRFNIYLSLFCIILLLYLFLFNILCYLSAFVFIWLLSYLELFSSLCRYMISFLFVSGSDTCCIVVKFPSY